jgi:ABC-type lipoprotein export system ATPase subunit
VILCEHVQKRFSARGSGAERRWDVEELRVEKGERVLVSGPSGCGKSTLLNLLAGLVRPDAGQITVDGQRLDQMSTYMADVFRGQHIGLVFQSFQLLPPLSALDNVLLGVRYGRKFAGREARTRAEALLERVGLRAWRGHRPAELSLGEQQRVAIARALVNEPPLILADEPTASLDAANAAAVLDLLFEMCQANRATLVTISHDTGMAPRFDRVVDASPWMSAAEGVGAHV